MVGSLRTTFFEGRMFWRGIGRCSPPDSWGNLHCGWAKSPGVVSGAESDCCGVFGPWDFGGGDGMDAVEGPLAVVESLQSPPADVGEPARVGHGPGSVALFALDGCRDGGGWEFDWAQPG